MHCMKKKCPFRASLLAVLLGFACFENAVFAQSSNVIVTTLAGSGTSGYADGNGTSASFSFPSGVAVDGSGNVYVADWGNHRIRKITPSGIVTTLAGSGSFGSTDGPGNSARFHYPSSLSDLGFLDPKMTFLPAI